ncbi:PaaI family thioesterase [Paraburkholderia sp. MM5482-R1]|uniref:PaaI family thioesterase n=1 Tax=unclassified Paraburkholderia TaxID=2615204 RepID=UPI003D25D1EB
MADLHTQIANSFNAQGLMLTLGAQLLLVKDGEVQIGLPFSSQLSQQHGYLHAGATSSILDSACGYAALTKVAPDFEVVTTEFKINLLRPAVGKRFLAIGRVQNAGKTLTVCTGEVRAFSGVGDEHKVIAIMQATIANLRR